MKLDSEHGEPMWPLTAGAARHLESESWSVVPRIFQGLASHQRPLLMEVACERESLLAKAVQEATQNTQAAMRCSLFNNHDLGTDAGVKLVLEQIEAENPSHVWMSPPCGPYSPLQRTNQRSEQQKQELARKRKEALKVYVGCSVIMHHCIQRGTHVTWELSERCDAWRLPLIQNLLRRYQLHTAVVKGCRVNLRDEQKRLLQKGWKIMTTQPRMAELLHKPCRCDVKYQHGKCEGAMAGKSALYTPEFTKLVVCGLQQELSFYGVQQEGQGISQTPDLFGGGETCVCEATCQSGHVQTCSCCLLGREHVPLQKESFVVEQREEQESEKEARDHVKHGQLSFAHMDNILHSLNLPLPKKGRGMMEGTDNRPAYFQFGAYNYGKFSGRSRRTQEYPQLCR